MTQSEREAVVEFKPAHRIGGKGPAPHQFQRALRGIAVDGAGRVYAVGDSAVKVFDAEGEPLRQWATRLPGESVAVDADGRVWVGQQGYAQKAITLLTFAGIWAIMQGVTDLVRAFQLKRVGSLVSS